MRLDPVGRPNEPAQPLPPVTAALTPVSLPGIRTMTARVRPDGTVVTDYPAGTLVRVSAVRA